MFQIDNWLEIFDTVRKNKLRTFLTAFSVAWGIFLLVVLLGAGTGLENGIKYQFRDDAVNSIWIFPGTTSKPYKGMNSGRRIIMKNGDLEEIKNSINKIDHITARFYLSGEYTVRYKNKYSSFNVRCVHPDHLFLEKTIVTSGRYINDLDVKERRKITVIGSKVVEVLFEDGEDPLDKYIDVNGIQYKVVGTYEDEGGENEMRNIYIPVSTGQMVYGGRDQIHRIMFTVGDASANESKAIEAKAMEIMANRHIFDPEDPKALFIRNGVEFFQQFINLFNGIAAFLWLVGIGTIIAGMVGVSNIMLIVAKERTREIGIRKALGASPRSIISLFLQESITITLIAGYTGLILGVGLIELINLGMSQMSEQPEFFRNPEINLATAISATILLVLVGAIAGYIPAKRAAKVDPIVALREE